MAQVKVQLQGYVPAFSDATVKLTNDATGSTVERRVFLDGSLTLGDLDPGSYEMEVRHPNLVLPIDRRRIRIFPQPGPTFVPVVLDPVQFVDNPIRTLPVADLTSVQQATTSVQQQAARVGGKVQGDSIRSSDWNALAGAVSDLAGAVLELTHRVSPVGHAHPEIADKIEEVQGNVRKLSDAVAKSLLELQRQIELELIRRHFIDALDAGAAPDPVRQQTLGKLDDLQGMIQTDPKVFTKQLADTANVMLTTVGNLASAQGAKAGDYLARPGVKNTQDLARHYLDTGMVESAESELNLYRRTTAITGGKFAPGAK
jgi:hypothetical protein